MTTKKLQIMKTYLRFTEIEPTQNEISYNGFNNTELKGICCFELNDEESLYFQSRKIAEKYSNYVKNSNGIAFIFQGKFIEENFNNEGVIAKYNNTIEKIQLIHTEHGYKIL
jgi:hypothetical protein